MGIVKLWSLSLLLVTVTGCMDGGAVLGVDAPFYISALISPSSDCRLGQGEEFEQRTFGILDLALSQEYQVAAVLHSELERSDANALRTLSAYVRVWHEGGDESPIVSTPVLTPGYVPSDSVEVSHFPVLSASMVNVLIENDFHGRDLTELGFDELLGYDQEVNIGFSIEAITVGGRDIESPELQFSLRICFGCLVTCPPESANEDSGLLCESREPPATTPCWLGQDEEVDCRLCSPILGAEVCRGLCTTL